MRILIAEDERVSRIFLDAKLKDLGHEVLEAYDGIQAWDLFRAENPRILITDWMMPGLDGVDLCARVRDP